MFADPSKLTPPMVLAFANAVAVAALPVQDPDEPDVLPVTLPIRFPMNVVAVVVPDTLTFCRKVAFVLVLILSVTAIPVSADPSIAGNVDGNLSSGIVPELRFDALREDPVIYPAPLVIALLFRDMFADPSKLTPAIVLAVASFVEVAALPVISSLAVIKPAPFVS